MGNPHKAGPGDGCIVHAGILTPHGGDVSKAELTSGYPQAAKDMFIKAIVDRLTFKIPVPFPCGIEIEPLPPDQSSLLQDLADKEKYPDFHANVLGHYTEIARSLDAQSEFNLLPICDPIALGFKIGVDIKIPGLPDFMKFAMPNIPALAVELQMPPIELAAKIPSLVPPIPPALPSFNFNLPIPPDAFLDLYEFRGIPPQIKFPSFIADIVPKIPDFMIDLIGLNISGFLGDICKLARDTLFAKQQSDDKGIPQDVVRIVATEVLARKIIEMTIMHAMAKTIGSAPSGLVGQFGLYQGYDIPKGEPQPEEDDETRVRDRIVNAAYYSEGLCWSDDDEDPTVGKRPYTNFLFPFEASDPKTKQAAYKMAEQVSACGIHARRCLAEGGASFVFANGQFSSKKPVHTTPNGKNVSYDYFNGPYPPASAVTALIAIAIKRKAFIPPPHTISPTNPKGTPQVDDNGVFFKVPLHELPDLKRGDIIVIGNPNKNDDHVMVVTEDYKRGDKKLVGVHGGQNDQDNVGTATYIQPPTIETVPSNADIAANTGATTSSVEQESTNTAEKQAKIDEQKQLQEKAKAEYEKVLSEHKAAVAAAQKEYDANATQENSAKLQQLTDNPPPLPPILQKGPIHDSYTQTKPKKGIRCTGIQGYVFYAGDEWEKRKNVPATNGLMPGPSIGRIGIRADGGINGHKDVVEFGVLKPRLVKALINSYVLIRGMKDGDVDTTQVGRVHQDSTETVPPLLRKNTNPDSNDENEYPLDEFLKKVNELKATIANSKADKKKEKASKAEADSAKAEAKRNAKLEEQNNKPK